MKAQGLLPKVFNFPFTYNSFEQEKIGDVVEVPFGSKNEIGVIWKNKYSEPKNIKIKNIVRKTGYSIDAKLVDFIEWFYHHLGHRYSALWEVHRHHHKFFNPSPFAVIADEVSDTASFCSTHEELSANNPMPPTCM